MTNCRLVYVNAQLLVKTKLNEKTKLEQTSSSLTTCFDYANLKANVDRRELAALLWALEGSQLSQTVMNNYHCNGVVL